MANLTIPIQVNLPEDWLEQIVDRLRNDPDAEWIEVVRCIDCENWDTSWQIDPGTDRHYCPTVDRDTPSNFYCGDAERKTDDKIDKSSSC